MRRTSRMMLLTLAVVLSACSGGGSGTADPSPVAAQPWGQVDTAFGSEGKLVTGGSAYTPQPRMSRGLDGSLYTVGDRGLEKWDANGRLVASFGNAGSVMLGNARKPTLGDEAGNVYVVADSALLKLDPLGQPVVSFGTNGRVTWEAWVAGDIRVFSFQALARDAAGNLFMSGQGYTPQDGFRWGVVAKLDPEGRLVGSFGNSGLAVIDRAHAGASVGMDLIALDAGRNIYLGGGLIAKLDATGKLVREFANEGYLHIPDCSPMRSSSAAAFVVDAAGNLLVGAECSPPGVDYDAFVFKFDERGALIPSYRESGTRPRLFGVGPNGEAVAGLGMGAMVAAPDGGVYLAGHRFKAPCGNDLVVVKLDAQGNPMPTFDGTDNVVLDGQLIDFAGDIALDAQGRLYVSSSGVPYCPIVRPIGGGNIFVYRIRG